MNNQKFNWQIWLGFLLSLVSLFSYPLVFVRFPVTRDFPWVNLLLFGIAAVLLFVGLRRAFARPRPARSKISGIVLTTLSALAGAGENGRDIARSAEFLLDSGGTVRWVNLTENYWVRARPEQILEAVKSLD